MVYLGNNTKKENGLGTKTPLLPYVIVAITSLVISCQARFLYTKGVGFILMPEEKKSYYAIIPAEIRYDKDLCPNAKLLYGEITALCNEKGYCWASNRYFSNLYNVHKNTISKWINDLSAKGYIYTEIKWKNVGYERKIKLTLFSRGINKMLNRYKQKAEGGVKEKVEGCKRKAEHNNTINNTINNTYNKEVSDIIKHWNTMNLPQCEKITKERTNLITEALKEYPIKDIMDSIRHYNEAMNNKDYFENYVWAIEVFFKRGRGYTSWFTKGEKWQSYLNWYNKLPEDQKA